MTRGAKRFAARFYRVLKEGLDSWTGSRARARRGPSPPDTQERWLSEDERRLLEALSAAIVPSDATGPGAREAGVVEILDRRLASSPSHQGLYARGLPDYDRRSRKRYGLRFAELAAPQQTDLLREIDRLSDSGAISGAGKFLGRALQLYRSARSPAVHLFPVLVDDVMQAFYTNPVSWEWLGYDGPPMPRGYLDLVHPRT